MCFHMRKLLEKFPCEETAELFEWAMDSIIVQTHSQIATLVLMVLRIDLNIAVHALNWIPRDGLVVRCKLCSILLKLS